MNENENAAPVSDRPGPSASDGDGRDHDPELGQGNGDGGKDAPTETTPPEKRKRKTADSVAGGDLSASETGLVDLYGPEEWDGPDLFGEYSPEQEASMASTTPAAPAMESSMPDVSITKRADRKNAR